MRRWSLALLLFLCTIVGVAYATTMRPVPAKCPVCTHDFEAWIVGSTNSVGGYDSDLFAQAAGEQPVVVAVWTCPKCRYSATKDAFPKGVSAATAEKIRAGFEPAEPFAPDTSQLRIPAWVKFDLADRVLAMEEAAAAKRAEMNLLGSWSVRSEVMERFEGPPGDPVFDEEWKAAEQRYEAIWRGRSAPRRDGWAEAQRLIASARDLLAEGAAARGAGNSTGATEIYACLRLLARGEGAEPRATLATLAADPSSRAVTAAAATRLLGFAKREANFQTRYLEFSEQVIAGNKESGADLGVRLWRMAELTRRLGRSAEAVTAYRRAVAAQLPPWLLPRAQTTLTSLGSPLTEAELAAARSRIESALCDELLVPETADDAAAQLCGTAGPKAVEVIVRCLANEDPKLREAGIAALKSEMDPGPAAVLALVAVMADDKIPALRKAAAEALAKIQSPAAAPGFIEELAYKTDVQLIAARALGHVGDADAVPALLDAKFHEVRLQDPPDVLRLVAALTNRSHASVAAAREWYAAHAAEGRRTWVVSGFKEAGLPCPDDLWDRKHVPLLIGWLEDSRLHVRTNALRVLTELTGQRIAQFDVTYQRVTERTAKELAAAAAAWRDWWDANRPADGDKK